MNRRILPILSFAKYRLGRNAGSVVAMGSMLIVLRGGLFHASDILNIAPVGLLPEFVCLFCEASS